MIGAPTLQLRPRQRGAIQKLYAAFRSNYRLVLLVLPTGGGKRFMAVYLCQVAVQNGRRVLFVTNRRLLVSQMFKEAERFGVDHGVIMSDSAAGNSSAPIQIASVQTLESRYMRPGMGAQHGVGLPPADLVIIDEGHQDVDRYVELLKCYPDAKVCSLTATPVGTEGKSLVPPYEFLVEGCLNTELIADGLLLRTLVYAPSEPNIQGVKIVSKGEYNQGQLGRAVKECTVFADVFNEWAPFADRATVCFVPGVAYGNDLEHQFNMRLGSGKARMISAKTPQDEREQIFQDVQDGKTKVLISVDVLREGFDLPILSCGIDLQPNSQLRTYWQKLGRVKRAADGQTEAIWLDFAGNYWRFPHPDEDPEWPTGEETTQEIIERRRKEEKERQPLKCPKCSVAYQPTSRPPKCPQCGCVISGEPKRVVRMGNGRLKSIPAHAKKKREKTEAERKLSIWKSTLFGAMRTGRSCHASAVIYRNKTGEWPRDGWPAVFAKDSLNWKRSVGEVLTPRDLAIQCSQAARSSNAQP